MRARGTGGIVKRSRSRFWYVCYYDGAGRQIQESSKSESKMVAEQLLQKRLGEIRLGLPAAYHLKKLRYETIRQALLDDYANQAHSLHSPTGQRVSGG